VNIFSISRALKKVVSVYHLAIAVMFVITYCRQIVPAVCGLTKCWGGLAPQLAMPKILLSDVVQRFADGLNVGVVLLHNWQ
jgi:hypothetical protein